MQSDASGCSSYLVQHPFTSYHLYKINLQTGISCFKKNDYKLDFFRSFGGSKVFGKFNLQMVTRKGGRLWKKRGWGP